MSLCVVPPALSGVMARTAPRRSIRSIEFGVLSAAAVTRHSVCHVDVLTVYEKSVPTNSGLNDVRMGTVDRRLACATCGHGVVECTGHAGHRQLGAPCYHYCFVDKVYKLLKVVCYFCSALLVDPSATDEKDPRARFIALTGPSAKVAKACPECQAPQPHYSCKKQATLIRAEWPVTTGLTPEEEASVKGAHFTPYRAWLILKGISDAHVRALGLNPDRAHPETLVLRTLAIPPPCVRPSIMVTQGSRSMGMDDLTSMLREVIKADIAVTEETEALQAGGATYTDLLLAPGAALEEKWAKLQEAINCYFAQDNASGALKKGGALAAKRRNLAARLKHKEGRLRGNLNGKRVNQSARTVISPEAELDVHELGIPPHVALTLTVTEVVCEQNYDTLLAAVRRGTGVQGGAKAVIQPGGRVIRLDMVGRAAGPRGFQTLRQVPLSYGDKVERHVRDGDLGVFNRQPSLHKLSLIGLKLRIVEGKTFRLAVPATTGFNADFDGDEMNLHIAQDPLARAEIQHLMMLPQHIVTPQNSTPITCLKQDSLLGIFLLCQPGVVLPWERYCQLVMAVRYPRRPVPRGARPDMVGAEVLSLCLPPDMNLRMASTELRGGVLVSGAVTKGVAKAIIHYLWKRSPELACEAMSDMQRVSNAYILMRGVSVGIWDCLACPSALSAVRHMLTKVDELTDGVARDVAATDLGSDVLESTTAPLLASALNYAGQVCQATLTVTADAARTNTIMAMVQSGSKGSMVNIAQLMGVVGQQFVDGARIEGSLPCFAPGDTGPNARGFVRHSFMQGLTPPEFFYHAMGGREGLVDTSVKTATTGYMQRKLIKGMESCHAAYDGTVRNSNQEVIQFSYGGDNFDATHLVKHTLPLLLMSNLDILCVSASVDECARLVRFRDDLRAQRPLNALRPMLSDEVFVPCHAQWVLDQVGAPDAAALPPDPSQSWAWMDCLLKEVEAALECSGTLLLKAYLAYHYRHAIVAPYSLAQLEKLTARVCAAVRLARVAPMEMVGELAAEMCGEPATQLTLNSFHTSGNLHSVNQGVPRLNELLNLNKASKTPAMLCPLLPPYCHSARFAQLMARNMPYTVLHQVVITSAVVPSTFDAQSALDVQSAQTVKARALVDPEYCAVLSSGKLAPWALRFELDMEAMLSRDMTPQVISGRLEGALATYLAKLEAALAAKGKKTGTDKPKTKRQQKVRASQFWVLASVYTEAQWVLLVHLGAGPHFASPLDMQAHLNRVLEMHVCGVPGITAARAVKVTAHVPTEDGGLDTAQVYAVSTAGVNLGALALMPTVDARNLVANEVHDVWAMYGLHAAAKMLYHEIKAVLSFDSSNLHDRHIMLIVHSMTRLGDIMAMNRHGINKQRTGPLIRSSFEQPMEVLSDAAMFAETDGMGGVSENIIMGKLAPIGTGGMGILDSRAQVPQRQDTVVCSTMDILLPSAPDWKPLLPPLPDMETVDVEAPQEQRTFGASDPGAYCPSSPPPDGHLALVYCPSSP